MDTNNNNNDKKTGRGRGRPRTTENDKSISAVQTPEKTTSKKEEEVVLEIKKTVEKPKPPPKKGRPKSAVQTQKPKSVKEMVKNSHEYLVKYLTGKYNRSDNEKGNPDEFANDMRGLFTRLKSQKLINEKDSLEKRFDKLLRLMYLGNTLDYKFTTPEDTHGQSVVLPVREYVERFLKEKLPDQIIENDNVHKLQSYVPIENVQVPTTITPVKLEKRLRANTGETPKQTVVMHNPDSDSDDSDDNDSDNLTPPSPVPRKPQQHAATSGLTPPQTSRSNSDHVDPNDKNMNTPQRQVSKTLLLSPSSTPIISPQPPNRTPQPQLQAQTPEGRKAIRIKSMVKDPLVSRFAELSRVEPEPEPEPEPEQTLSNISQIPNASPDVSRVTQIPKNAKLVSKSINRSKKALDNSMRQLEKSQDIIKRSKSQMQELQNVLEEERIAQAKHLSIIQQLEQTKRMHDLTINDYKNHTEMLQKRIEDLEKIKIQTSTTVRDLEHQLNEYKSTVTRLNVSLSDKDVLHRTELETSKRNAEQRIVDLEHSISAIEHNTTASTLHLESQINDQKRIIEGLNNSLQHGNAEQQAQHQREIHEANQTIHSLQSHISSIQHEIANQSGLNTTINELRNEISVYNTKLLNEFKKSSETERKLIGENQKQRELNAQIDNYKRELNQSKEEHGNLTRSYQTEMENERRKQNEQLQQMQSVIAQYEATKQQMESQNASQMQSKDQEINNLRQQMESQNASQIQLKDQEINELKQQMAQFQQQQNDTVQHYENEISRLEQQQQYDRQHMTMLNSQLQDAQARNIDTDQARHHIEELRRNIAHLSGQYNQADAELNNTRRLLDIERQLNQPLRTVPRPTTENRDHIPIELQNNDDNIARRLDMTDTDQRGIRLDDDIPDNFDDEAWEPPPQPPTNDTPPRHARPSIPVNETPFDEPIPPQINNSRQGLSYYERQTQNTIPIQQHVVQNPTPIRQQNPTPIRQQAPPQQQLLPQRAIENITHDNIGMMHGNLGEANHSVKRHMDYQKALTEAMKNPTLIDQYDSAIREEFGGMINKKFFNTVEESIANKAFPIDIKNRVDHYFASRAKTFTSDHHNMFNEVPIAEKLNSFFNKKKLF